MAGSPALKLGRLKRIIRDRGPALVAFSGGVDSSFLLKVAHEALDGRVLAVTAVSPTSARGELSRAKRIARAIGAKHLVVRSNEMKNPKFTANPPERCYLCKLERFSALKKIANKRGYGAIFDGSNADDGRDYRPGMKAVRELGVFSPLAQAGMTKAEIRKLSRRAGLPTWNKPAAPCLATRIPYGTRITPQRLKAIDRAEEGMRQLGYANLRVRHEGSTARIELDLSRICKAALPKNRAMIVKAVKSAGFKHVSLDLEGYRQGSMNREIKI
jgi:uncharacterized protein